MSMRDGLQTTLPEGGEIEGKLGTGHWRGWQGQTVQDLRAPGSH